jgi:hypothetical protein
VLTGRGSAFEPFIAWVKEGRKYDLGAVMITQQPGSLPMEILSQGDNWFVFHLLASSDLQSLKHANAHFSDDLLSSLLNEPIPGHGIFWSSVGGKAYPIPIRALSFEDQYSVRDRAFNAPMSDVYARSLGQQLRDAVGNGHTTLAETSTPGDTPVGLPDVLHELSRKVVDRVRQDPDLRARLAKDGVPWGKLQAFIEDILPPTLASRRDQAHHMVVPTMTSLYGQQNEGWFTFKKRTGATWIRAGRS